MASGCNVRNEATGVGICEMGDGYKPRGAEQCSAVVQHRINGVGGCGVADAGPVILLLSGRNVNVELLRISSTVRRDQARVRASLGDEGGWHPDDAMQCGAVQVARRKGKKG